MLPFHFAGTLARAAAVWQQLAVLDHRGEVGSVDDVVALTAARETVAVAHVHSLPASPVEHNLDSIVAVVEDAAQEVRLNHVPDARLVLFDFPKKCPKRGSADDPDWRSGFPVILSPRNDVRA